MWKDFIALKSTWIYLTLVWFWGISWWPAERKTHFLRQFSRNFFEMCPHTIVRECNFDVQGSHESFVFELLHSHCGGICIYKQRFQSCILSVSATLAADMIVLQRKKCEKIQTFLHPGMKLRFQLKTKTSIMKKKQLDKVMYHSKPVKATLKDTQCNANAIQILATFLL